MQVKVNGSEPFKCLQSTFTIAATSAGYTLQYSADKVTWTSHAEVVPANENVVVNDATPYSWFRLEGNVDNDVLIIL